MNPSIFKWFESGMSNYYHNITSLDENMGYQGALFEQWNKIKILLTMECKYYNKNKLKWKKNITWENEDTLIVYGGVSYISLTN